MTGNWFALYDFFEKDGYNDISVQDIKKIDCTGNDEFDCKESIDAVSLCTGLETLILKDCEGLEELPDSFALLKSLKLLDISGTGIEEIPQALLDREKAGELAIIRDDNWLAKVREDGNVLADVPEKLKTKKICLAALEFALQKRIPVTIKHIPKGMWNSPEFRLAAVKTNANVIQRFPESYKTPEICLAAVEQIGIAIQATPEERKTLEICLAAVKADNDALEFVPSELQKQVKKLAGIK